MNEVGGDPGRFGNSPSVFHALNAQRLGHWPGSLATTATHDTKRGEDTRIRIDAISELADEWRIQLARWKQWNARKKVRLGGGDEAAEVPDAREEYLLYQTLVGAWPFGGPDDAPPPGFVERIQQYMVKAVREAKVNTSWTDTDPSYADAVARFVAEILEGPDAGPFLKYLVPFARRVARIGVVHSLAQTLLKLTTPGRARHLPGLRALGPVPGRSRQPPPGRLRAAVRAAGPHPGGAGVRDDPRGAGGAPVRGPRGRRDQALPDLDGPEPPQGRARALRARGLSAPGGRGGPQGQPRGLRPPARGQAARWSSRRAWSPA